MTRRTIVLVIFDGFGVREDRHANAVALARTPTYSELLKRYPTTTLHASGRWVGLPDDQMGNSEVGHMNMGAGQVVYQDLTRIDGLIENGDFFRNPVLTRLLDRSKTDQCAVHLIGLVSDGGVHSHQRHLHAIIDLAARRGVDRVYVHAITDGRDTSPTGGIRYLGQLTDVMQRVGTGRIATVTGRYYAMDRDRRWDRTRRAYEALTLGEGRRIGSPIGYLEESYEAAITDEFIEPAVVVKDGQPMATIRDGDAVLLFNFRADRARQLTSGLTKTKFEDFERKMFPKTEFVCFTEYDATYGLPVVFEPQSFSGSLAEVLAPHGVTNLRLAETEKYAHVTYFFNCGEERPYAGEDRILIPSPKIATYDLQPEMSARGITDALIADLENRRHDVIICNFANADMVGHTGKLDAAVAAVEALDGCLARIVPAVQQAQGGLILTADHGNCEQMWDPELESPHTAHTSNPVPLIIVDPHAKGPLRTGGALCDVAPTILGLLDLPVSPEMTGTDLRQD